MRKKVLKGAQKRHIKERKLRTATIGSLRESKAEPDLVGLHLAAVKFTGLYLDVMMGTLRSSFQSRAVHSPADRKYFGKNGLLATAYTAAW